MSTNYNIFLLICVLSAVLYLLFANELPRDRNEPIPYDLKSWLERLIVISSTSLTIWFVFYIFIR